jgi:hypothetical protein
MEELANYLGSTPWNGGYYMRRKAKIQKILVLSFERSCVHSVGLAKVAAIGWINGVTSTSLRLGYSLILKITRHNFKLL